MNSNPKDVLSTVYFLAILHDIILSLAEKNMMLKNLLPGGVVRIK